MKLILPVVAGAVAGSAALVAAGGRRQPNGLVPAPDAKVAILHGADGERHSYVTVDGGSSWQTTPLPFKGRGVCSYGSTLFAVGFEEDGSDFHGFAAASTDGGATWNATKLPEIVGACTATSPTTMLAAGANGVIVRTTDGGSTYDTLFTTYDNHDTFNAVVALPGVLLAAGVFQNPNVLSQAEILMARDDPAGSHQWTNLTGAWIDNGDYAITTALACPGVVLVGDDDGFFYTSRDARAARFSPRQFVGHSMRISAAACVGVDGIWMVQYENNGGVCLMCTSQDSAKTFDCSVDLTSADVKPLSVWAADTGMQTVFATSADDSGLGTASKLYQSTDGGNKWTVVATPAVGGGASKQ